MTERPRRENAGRLMQQASADYESSEDEENEDPLLFDPGPEIDPIVLIYGSLKKFSNYIKTLWR
jgi:hypothetical protein